MATEIWVNIGSGNGLLPDGTKPLPEPMLTAHQWSPVTFILGQFYKRSLNHQSPKDLLENYMSKILFKFPRGQWVNHHMIGVYPSVAILCYIHPHHSMWLYGTMATFIHILWKLNLHHDMNMACCMFSFHKMCMVIFTCFMISHGTLSEYLVGTKPKCIYIYILLSCTESNVFHRLYTCQQTIAWHQLNSPSI